MSVVPTKNDVLFGRGNISATHEGNIKFRSIVESRKQEYIEAAWNEKKKIVISIMRQIQSMDPPGRFLQRDPKFQGVESNLRLGLERWVPVDEERAASKVSHCLREKRKEEKGSLENEPVDNGIIPLDLIFGQASPCVDESKLRHGDDNKSSTLASASASLSIHLSSTKNATTSKDLGCDTVPSPLNDDHSQNDINKLFENAASMPLREWIKRAISATVESDSSYSTSLIGTCTSSRLSHKVSDSLKLPNSYIIPSLNIAYSLAEQLCDAQEMGNYSFLPTTSVDWAKRVIVDLETPATRNQTMSHPEPSSAKNDSSSQDPFHALIDSIALDSVFDRDEIHLESSVSDIDFKFDDSGSMKSIRLTKARLLLPIRGEITGIQVKTEMQRIHLLGSVFYELFSGGEIPLERQRNDNFNADDEGNFTSGKLGELKISANEASGRCDHFRDSSNQNQTKKSRYDDELSEKMMAVETMTMRGIPTPLSDLISNMLDAIDGDLRRDEAYHRMADVRDDLKLMLHKPSKFLRNPNIETLSRSGLKLPDTIYGQQNELNSLKECYNNSLKGNHEFAIIAGPSGTGKTVLANRFAEIVVADGGSFLSGKFDQFQQAAPFSALSCAFNEYCNMLIGSVDSQNAVIIASTLRDVLGQDATHLIKVIPNLSMIMGDICNVDTQRDCVDAQKRLQYLLCRFVEIISDSSSHPVVLFLDDLQWADAASITVIAQILNSTRSSRFFLVGSCRDDEMSDNHPIWNMISTVQKLGVNATMINISPLGEDLVNEMVSDTLRLFPRVTRSLADILYHKTKGNPLFLSRLMVSLSRNGLLRFSLCRRRWEWEEEKIQSMKIPDDVAELLTNTIGRLPQDVQDALCTMSCFGASIDINIIDVLERDLDLQLKDSLEVARKEGFVENSDKTFKFSHDRVQEVAYNMLNSQDRRAKHSKYGFTLCIYAMNGCNESMLFTAVDQINRGGKDAIIHPEHGSLVARLNLRAGKKAMEISDFVSALRFFEHGISFLQESHWQQEYDLSLELFNCSTKCAYAVGDQDKLRFRTDQVLAFGRAFEDKLNVLYYLLSALCDASLLNEAITKAVWVLSMLGEDLNLTSSRDEILALIEETKKMLIEVSDDTLLNYNPMTDSSKIMAMKFLSRLELPLLMTNSDFVPIVVMQMVKMTLAHGMSPMSAIGFVYFGGMLASLGQLREGYRFVNLAKRIVECFGSKEMAGEVIAISSQTIGYIEPMQSMVEFYSEGHSTALKAGDIRSASLNLLLHCECLVWSGSYLNHVMIKYDEAGHFMKQHNVLSLLFIAETRELDKLVNGFESKISTEPDCSSEQFLQGKNPFAAQSFRLQELTISFIYRDFEATKNAAEKYLGCKFDSWVALCYRITESFIIGLVSFWIYRQTNSIQWLETGVRMKQMMQKWSEASQWNFLHKFNLLEAEEHFCNKSYESAKLSYDTAISFAARHKFIFDEALACELAGHFALQILNRSTSYDYYKRAYEKYRDWGAHGKAATLLQYQ